MRVYFHLVSEGEVIQDFEGVEVSSPQEARVQASRVLEELRQEDPSAARAWSGFRLIVADASGTVLFSLDLN